MIAHTFMVFGPGGIGKSPIDELVRGDAYRIDPYRLRVSGPRDSRDVFYAHPKLHSELKEALLRLDDPCDQLCSAPVVEWYSKSQAVFFQVREEWQGLFLGGCSAAYAKAEIYAPIVPVLLANPGIKAVFGQISIVILNPANALSTLGGDFSAIQSATQENCRKRGDQADSIRKRTESVPVEAAAWTQLMAMGATEFSNWAYPEYVVQTDRVNTLRAARKTLIEGNPALAGFLKSDEEIV